MAVTAFRLALGLAFLPDSVGAPDADLHVLGTGTWLKTVTPKSHQSTGREALGHFLHILALSSNHAVKEAVDKTLLWRVTAS